METNDLDTNILYEKKLQMIFGILIAFVWIAAVSFYIITNKEFNAKRGVYLEQQAMAKRDAAINRIKNMSNTEKGKRIQTILNNRYSANLTVDGKVGKNTFKAIQKYTDIDNSNLSATEKQDLTSVLLYLEGY